jgi:DNA-binding MarR family transcriptional regulator
MIPVEQLYSAFYEAYLLLDDNERHFFNRYEMSSARYHALLHIQQSPGLSLRELSDYLLCTKGNTTRIVKSLELQGYLTRQVDQTDSRALCLHVTAKGQALLQQVTSAYHEFKSSCFGKLMPAEQDVLMQNLSSLSSHLRANLRDG